MDKYEYLDNFGDITDDTIMKCELLHDNDKDQEFIKSGTFYNLYSGNKIKFDTIKEQDKIILSTPKIEELLKIIFMRHKLCKYNGILEPKKCDVANRFSFVDLLDVKATDIAFDILKRGFNNDKTDFETCKMNDENVVLIFDNMADRTFMLKKCSEMGYKNIFIPFIFLCEKNISSGHNVKTL